MERSRLIELKVHGDDRGSLIALEKKHNIPFDVKRVFYIYDTKRGTPRGQHANIESEQMLICVSGSCKIKVDNGKEQEENVKEINHLVEENDSLECFIKNLHEIRNIEDENHRVYKIGDIVDKNLIDNDVYRFIFNTNKKVKVKLGFLQINKYENNIRKWHEIKIFGKKFRITLKKYK